MVVLFLLGLLDAVAGALVLLTNNPILPQIAKYVGIVLLAKGLWSLLTGWRSFWMVFFVLGAIDALGGAVLFFSNASPIFTYVGVAMMAKGAFSIAGDMAYILSGK